jgi:hypothetical protein
MKKTLSLILLGAISVGIVSAEAATKSKRSAARRSHLGEAMRPKKSLKFDGRSVEALKPGNYDSLSHLDDGNGNRGAKHLYDLPKDFASRTADDQSELRYRQ